MATLRQTKKNKPGRAYWLTQEIQHQNNHVNENNVGKFEFKHATNDSTISSTTKYGGMKKKVAMTTP
jgi:predicted RNA-binding protein YlxR (DUF448 family)